MWGQPVTTRRWRLATRSGRSTVSASVYCQARTTCHATCLYARGRSASRSTAWGGVFFAQEGMYEFGSRAWGPQPVRNLMLNSVQSALSAMTAGDIGVKTPVDLKGKRVAWIIGAPALNQNMTATLAFGGLTWDDVEKVEFGGYGAAWDGIVANQADSVFGSSIAGKAYALEKSNRGITYPVMDPEDKEGWARVQAVGSYFYPLYATEGAGLSAENGVHSSAYPYPILMTYADRDASLVSKVTNAMIDTFDMYKDAAPGADGWALDKQRLEWVVPLHEGAVNVFKDKGMWTDDLQQNQENLVKRQEVLEAAWKDVNSRQHDSDDAFQEDWMKTRADALKAAGMDPILERW
ncbi:C4-dicarboxylate ABC transporter [Orrella marina]|uniref:C4-dicarboxylate ABC transporter n=2 Tax=Orrella marina TaxID=2163011 RepID=A0A2R4XMM5_9BURK|nr:C4-dicarboxylate ABC transporter [Orrella marina]